MRSESEPDSFEHAIRHALRPAVYIKYDDAYAFVERLEAVKADIDRIAESDPAKGVHLLETFIAGCYEKAGEIDDSGDHLGMFIDDLFSSWIKARQSANSDPHETVRVLFNWRDNDDWGYCHDIEKTAVKALNRQGLKAFGEIAYEEFTKERSHVAEHENGNKNVRGSYRYRWLSEVLRTLHSQQGDAESYLVIAEEMGLAPKDCKALAEIYEKRHEPEQAVKWVDRGLELEREKSWRNGSSWGLAEKRRELLKQLGGGIEALDSAWEAFKTHASKYSYETVMRYVPSGKRSEWRAKVLEVAQNAGLSDAIGLYEELEEWDLLAEVVRKVSPAALEDLSHFTTEPAAEKLDRLHADAAAKLYQAMGLRIVNAGKSKYYDAALGNFASAKDCFERAGLQRDWDVLVARILSEHGRKTSFMPGFKAFLVQGTVPRKPTFLESVQKRRSRQFPSE